MNAQETIDYWIGACAAHETTIARLLKERDEARRERDEARKQAEDMRLTAEDCAAMLYYETRN